MFVIVKSLIGGVPVPGKIGSNEFNFDTGESGSGKPSLPHYKLQVTFFHTCGSLWKELVQHVHISFNMCVLNLQENSLCLVFKSLTNFTWKMLSTLENSAR